eukprot:scaffold443_cov527-Prasinococcus_capsulatus_cf.AAC.35
MVSDGVMCASFRGEPARRVVRKPCSGSSPSLHKRPALARRGGREGRTAAGRQGFRGSAPRSPSTGSERLEWLLRPATASTPAPAPAQAPVRSSGRARGRQRKERSTPTATARRARARAPRRVRPHAPARDAAEATSPCRHRTAQA